MDVIVIGGGNAAFETVLQLVAYCKHVTLVNRSDTFRADEITVDKVRNHPKVTMRTNVDMLEVLGEKFVSGLKIKDKTTGAEETLDAMGIFVEIGQVSNGEFFKDLVEVNEGGKIKIDPWTQRTTQSTKTTTKTKLPHLHKTPHQTTTPHLPNLPQTKTI
jgi:thioredoxin reductase